jgi:SAM-dependent methyltransferase
MPEPPLPPRRLRESAGRGPDGRASETYYVEYGRHARARLDELLLEGQSWSRALDFGCGAGRVLRHFLDEAQRAEVWGCDINADAIAWLRQHLTPPLRVFQVSEAERRLPQEDGFFDAIWAVSVFTHLTDDWADWMLELHRVLSEDGRILLTFLNDGSLPLWNEVSDGEPWDPDRLGMAVFSRDAPWDRGGPMVFASEWWLRAHWGRAFEIEQLATSGFGHAGQGYALMRKHAGEFTPDDLRRPEPDEPRESEAAQAELERVRRQLEAVYASRSWRVTRPLRRLRRH